MKQFTMLLTRIEIINKVANESFPKTDYWVTSGAGLVLHGVKQETRDIDIGCTSELADLLIQNGAKWNRLGDGTRRIETNSGIELFENWFVDEIIEIEGIRVATLESIRKQKAKLNRTKDWEDIALIDRFLESQ
jgi:hypothetical protein